MAKAFYQINVELSHRLSQGEKMLLDVQVTNAIKRLFIGADVKIVEIETSGITDDIEE